MIILQKQDDRYYVDYKGGQLGWVELYDNPRHTRNCYVKIALNNLDRTLGKELWQKIKEIAGRPLQVMTDESDVAMTDFLTAGGFVCKRKCYEVTACAEDYIGGEGRMTLHYCSAGDQVYEDCCRMMYQHYSDAHKAINPLTASFTEFCVELPKAAVYAKINDSIISAAFCENNEIAYVCSSSERHFSCFAQSVISSMFKVYPSISFESDDCDWAAMVLRNMFINQDAMGFCTYVLEDSP